MTDTRKLMLVSLLALSAIGLWVWRFAWADGFDDQRFRQTQGIQAVVTDTRTTADGYVLTARVGNESSRPARQVVCTARLIDERGRPLAANPLVGVRNLAAREQRRIDVSFPLDSRATRVEGRIDVALVRWEED